MAKYFCDCSNRVSDTSSRWGEPAYQCGSIPCDEININPANKNLAAGARLYGILYRLPFSKHARYNRVAKDLGIPEDLFMANLIFDPSVKFGSLMENAMNSENAKIWFGVTPPDLTLFKS